MPRARAPEQNSWSSWMIECYLCLSYNKFWESFQVNFSKKPREIPVPMWLSFAKLNIFTQYVWIWSLKKLNTPLEFINSILLCLSLISDKTVKTTHRNHCVLQAVAKTLLSRLWRHMFRWEVYGEFYPYM